MQDEDRVERRATRDRGKDAGTPRLAEEDEPRERAEREEGREGGMEERERERDDTRQGGNPRDGARAPHETDGKERGLRGTFRHGPGAVLA